MVGHKNKLPDSLDEIPVGQPYPGVNCTGCWGPASCCHDVMIELTDDEAAGLRAAGTVLEEWQPQPEHSTPNWLQKLNIFEKLKQIRRTMGEVAVTYEMKGSCGHLVRKGDNMVCDVWGTDDQPTACKKFPPGCVACVRMQWRDRHSQQETDDQR